jgi:hypothetical protein
MGQMINWTKIGNKFFSKKFAGSRKVFIFAVPKGSSLSSYGLMTLRLSKEFDIWI